MDEFADVLAGLHYNRTVELIFPPDNFIRPPLFSKRKRVSFDEDEDDAYDARMLDDLPVSPRFFDEPVEQSGSGTDPQQSLIDSLPTPPNVFQSGSGRYIDIPQSPSDNESHVEQSGSGTQSPINSPTQPNVFVEQSGSGTQSPINSSDDESHVEQSGSGSHFRHIDIDTPPQSASSDDESHVEQSGSGTHPQNNIGSTPPHSSPSEYSDNESHADVFMEHNGSGTHPQKNIDTPPSDSSSDNESHAYAIQSGSGHIDQNTSGTPHLCNIYTNEQECGFDPNCNWTVRGCIRRKDVLSGAVYAGPYGPSGNPIPTATDADIGFTYRDTSPVTPHDSSLSDNDTVAILKLLGEEGIKTYDYDIFPTNNEILRYIASFNRGRYKARYNALLENICSNSEKCRVLFEPRAKVGQNIDRWIKNVEIDDLIKKVDSSKLKGADIRNFLSGVVMKTSFYRFVNYTQCLLNYSCKTKEDIMENLTIIKKDLTNNVIRRIEEKAYEAQRLQPFDIEEYLANIRTITPMAHLFTKVWNIEEEWPILYDGNAGKKIIYNKVFCKYFPEREEKS